MKRAEGSFSVEAAVIMPLVLLVLGTAMHAAISLYEETKELALAVMESEQQNPAEAMYDLELLRKMLGEESVD